MSTGLPLLARCQPSILSCSASRTASNSRLRGARSRMIAASPFQNASGSIPVLGAASFAMKSNRTGAIFNPWASIRFMMGFSREQGACALSGLEQQKRRRGAAGRVLLAPKKGAEEGPRRDRSDVKGGRFQPSDIGSKLHQLVEKNVRPRQ